MSTGVTVDCDFPAGNIVVDDVVGDDVFVRQDLRDTQGDWFYWSFRVRGAAGRRVTFHFTASNVIGVRGPAVNALDGHGWRWDERFGPDDRAFWFEFGDEQDEVYFAFAFPYTEPDLHNFLARHAGNDRLAVDTLCRSAKGRNVELLRVAAGNPPRHRILVAARHHACESMASFALEGFLEEVLSGSETGQWFGASAEVLAVPFVDKDGVEEGDQGKNRKPHDHNRDYAGPSIYPSVRAIRRLVPEWSGGRMTVALDFHCPARKGDWHEHIHFVEPECAADRTVWAGIQSLSTHLEQVNANSLPFDATENLRFGQRWNVADPDHACFASWAASFPELRLAATFEFPYANVHGRRVTPSSARQFGASLAAAVSAYIESQD